MERREFVASLLAGGSAGMCVDLTLFPLDTIKTRLQSQQGFYKAGGFRGIYAGVPSAAVGSFPNAAAFFVTYECTKSLLGAGGALSAPRVAPVTHMLAASLGEIVACLIRVPTEVIKQRTQASPSSTTYHILLATLREEGVRGLYRGFGSTILREIPFSLVQFPLWEYLKCHHLCSLSPASQQCDLVEKNVRVHVCGMISPAGLRQSKQILRGKEERRGEERRGEERRGEDGLIPGFGPLQLCVLLSTGT
ncbi:hypothetical protein JOB18_010616 [Solea senegalensis]|uniref:Mitochondrial S-adenosylmethionine carrier protein n=1 Tax=Solea senegalensis TaxID=28829 RepID=A0AAV6Q0T1_SOLSE|nr:hypothetical protein JOB18_010616 [Solea senegalensis]